MLDDYEQGWERKMPKEFEWLEGRDWDCVMTIPPKGWGYMKDWSGYIAAKWTSPGIEAC
ncbi:hypothetical protein [Sphingobacterium thalpophilum]|uniref:hypothetical protein n=1 Tax=Sphingobacterium thalpophilum TaxID=259 RepID=UPI003C712B78